MAYRKRRYGRRRGGIEDIFFPALLILFVLQLMPNGLQLIELEKMKAWLPFGIVAAAALLLGYLFIKLYPVWRRRVRYRTARMYEIDRMTGDQFEAFLKVYFRDLGYKVLPHTGGSRDKGGDLLLRDPAGRKVVVQAKRYSKRVPFEAVQQVHTARSLYGTDRAILISNYYFTKQTLETARQLNIELWDRDRLMEKMYRYRRDRKNETVNEASAEPTKTV